MIVNIFFFMTYEKFLMLESHLIYGPLLKYQNGIRSMENTSLL